MPTKLKDIRTIPSHSEVKAIVDYYPTIGAFAYKHRTPDTFNTSGADWIRERTCKVWNTRYADMEAFYNSDSKGYLIGNILGKSYLAHRVAWYYMTGEWPANEIDHIDHDKTNNRWNNLRCVTSGENHKNKPMFSNNKSGTTGVRWDDALGKGTVSICVDRVHKYLGTFTDYDEACEARWAAERKYGFAEGHGR